MLDQDLVLPQTVRAFGKKQPDTAAIASVDGASLSWGELSEQMAQWSGALAALGIKPGDLVATMMPSGFDAYLAWLASGWLRAVEVPVNNAYKAEMLRYVLADTEVRVAIVAQQFLERFTELVPQLPSLKTIVVPDLEEDVEPAIDIRVISRDEFLAGRGDPGADGPSYRDVAALVYTSGTTGASKGVLVPWAELQQGPAAQPPGLLEPRESYYSTYPSAHLTGKIALYTSALADARLVLRETFSVSAFWDDIRRFQVRACGLLGPMAALLMSVPEQADDADNPLDRVGMAPILPNVKEFKRRFGVSRVASGYGSTEIGWVFSSGWDPPDVRTCGRRRPGSPYEVRIVDADDEPVPAGTVGELVVRPLEPWVMNQGYWRKPEQTARAWRNGWFHTGDGFREDEDGWFYFEDRLKDALRRRGENISSFEVEAGITAHPEIEEAAVIGVPSELGEDDVKAVIVPVEGCRMDPNELIEWLESRLPRFMVPRYLEFVGSLPKTEGTLRVKKAVLREAAVTEQTWDRESAA